MKTEEAKKAVLDLARAEVGYHEKASNSQLNDKTANSGGANYTKYAEFLDSYAGFYNGPKQSFPWCDLFYDFLFVKTFGLDLGRQMLCQPLNSAGAGCLYSAQYYKEAGRFHRNSPAEADQIFFSYSPGEYSHTGIVESVNGNTITTIEGNSSDSVARRSYKIGDPSIVGYGTPKWDLAVNDWEKPWAVVVNGQIVNSSEWNQEEQEDQEAAPNKPKQLQPMQPAMIRNGSIGNTVILLQSALTERCYECGKIDGEFGSITEGALIEFQYDFGLEVDGIAGPETWPVLLYCDFEKKEEEETNGRT